MIQGPPRSGKTDVLREAHRRLATSYPLERRSTLITTPTSSLETRLIHQVLVAGEIPRAPGRSLLRQRAWAIAGLQREGGRILLADNLHNAAPSIRAARAFLPIWLMFCEDAHVDGVFTTTRRVSHAGLSTACGRIRAGCFGGPWSTSALTHCSC
jgi:Bacterial TniB protein